VSEIGDLMIGRTTAPAAKAIATARLQRRYSPVIWLSLLCLDAPLVALMWQWLFARTYDVKLDFSSRAALFLTAWLIYLVDRWVDTIELPSEAPMSLRHRFCKVRVRPWVSGLATILFLNGWVALRGLNFSTLLLGGTVLLLCLGYLVTNHSLGGNWRIFPMKELVIGILFAAGTVLVSLPKLSALPASLLVAFTIFACLCFLNCVSIAAWERPLDEAQGKTSLIIRWPGFERFLPVVGLFLVIIATSFAFRDQSPLFFCIASSALLLIALDLLRPVISRDERTALADLVLLTPLVIFLWDVAR
jgi:hypothetical protein